MKIVRLKVPPGMASLRLLEEDPPVPKAGEVLVRVRASSLNPHDDFVLNGVIPVADGRVPLSDAAGEVVACGEGVTELRAGDAVVSTFWPYWLSGDMTAAYAATFLARRLMDTRVNTRVCRPALSRELRRAAALRRRPRCLAQESRRGEGS